MARISIYIPDALKDVMSAHGRSINWSEVVRPAIDAAIANPEQYQRGSKMTEFIEAVAIEIAKRVSEAGARPEDWLNEGFVYRTVQQHAVAAMREAFAHVKPQPGHVYPPAYPPTTTVPSVAISWAILDILNPDVMSDTARFLLGGMIAGVVTRAYECGRDGKPLEQLAERSRQ